MSRTPHRPVHHHLTSFTEAAHLSATQGVASIICLEVGRHDVAIGHWRIPDVVEHPAEALVGVVAPDHWDAMGLTCDAHARAVTGTSAPVQSTVLVDRQASCASILDDGQNVARAVAGPPVGLMADALLRTLELPTPEPARPIGYLVESAWLDAIAAVVLGKPGAVRSWATVAELHPLAAPDRPGEPGVCLSVAVQALQAESSWARMLQLWAARATPTRHQPPGMTTIPLERWFDEGSFARWSLRCLPGAEELLPAVLDAVPDEIGGELLDALVAVGDGVSSDVV